MNNVKDFIVDHLIRLMVHVRLYHFIYHCIYHFNCWTYVLGASQEHCFQPILPPPVRIEVDFDKEPPNFSNGGKYPVCFR